MLGIWERGAKESDVKSEVRKESSVGISIGGMQEHILIKYTGDIEFIEPSTWAAVFAGKENNEVSNMKGNFPPYT